MFTTIHLDRMEAIMGAVGEDFGCELVECNGETEHVTCSSTSPTVALSRLVNSLQGVSSRRLRQDFPDLARHYWPGGCGRGRCSQARSEVLR